MNNLFDFTLNKKEVSDADKIEAELRALEAGSIEIDKELKLFNHWRGDQVRENVRTQGYPLINAEDMFFVMDGTASIEYPQASE